MEEIKIDNIEYREDLYPRFEPNQQNIEKAPISLGILCPDVCPDELSNMKAGYIIDGVFYPEISLAKTLLEQQREYNAKKKSIKTNIYFIQSIKGGPVKIGKTQNLTKRLKEIQRYCPFELTIRKTIKDVPSETEKQLHEKYKRFRKHGEWFESTVLEKEKNCNDN